jgi:hypothetical protein
METVKAYFNGLNGKTTKIVGKIDDKSTTYTVTREDNGNIKAVTDEEAAREVWHAIVNEENMTAGTGEDDSYITIANGSYIQIGNQILEFKNKDGEDLKLDDFSKLNAMDEQIRAAVALNTAEEMIENVVIYLEPGTILSVGESQVELNKDAKMTIDIDGVDERTLSPILTELKSAENMSQLITKGLSGMSQILTLMGGKTTTVTFEFGHNFGEPEWTWADDLSTAEATFTCENNAAHKETVDAAVTKEEGREVVYTATVTGPDGSEYTDTRTAPLPFGNYKFRTRISSDSAAGTGSVTGTVYADYNADLVFAGPSVSRTNATLELWMQNVASLGVD